MVPRAESVTWKPIPAYIRVDFYDHAVNDDKVEILFSFTFESYPCELETWSKEGMQWRKLIMNDHWMDRDFFKIYWSILERNTCSTGRRYVRATCFLPWMLITAKVIRVPGTGERNLCWGTRTIRLGINGVRLSLKERPFRRTSDPLRRPL